MTWLRRLLVVVTSVTLLAACGGGGPSAPSPSTSSSTSTSTSSSPGSVAPSPDPSSPPPTTPEVTPSPKPSSPPPIPTPSPTPTPGPTPKPTPTPTLPAAITQRDPGWALDRIDQRKLPLDRSFTTTGQGAGVTVYVVDGLFDVSNPEFEGRASVGLKLGRSCVLEDGISHGLFVAGLAAGRRTGVAKKAKVVSVGSSYGCEGAGEVSDELQAKRVVKALDWVGANARKPAVVNLSLNADGKQPAMAAAVQRLIAKGLTVVASAGNQGEDACSHVPAGLPSVITVTGSTKSDRDAKLNHGRCVNIYAPARGVRSVVDTFVSADRVAISDATATSWAAPIVAGAAALYLSVHPEAGPDEVRGWLLRNATTGVIRGDRRGSPDRLLYVGGLR